MTIQRQLRKMAEHYKVFADAASVAREYDEIEARIKAARKERDAANAEAEEARQRRDEAIAESVALIDEAQSEVDRMHATANAEIVEKRQRADDELREIQQRAVALTAQIAANETRNQQLDEEYVEKHNQYSAELTALEQKIAAARDTIKEMLGGERDGTV